MAGFHDPFPSPAEAPRLPAESLPVHYIDEFYNEELRTSTLWNLTLQGWKHIEYDLSDPVRQSDIEDPTQRFQAPRRVFDKVLDAYPHPLSEVYRFATTGRAYLPLFSARRLRPRQMPTTEEKMSTYAALGDGLNYTFDYSETPEMGTVAELVPLSISLRPRARMLLYPGSPREALGHNTDIQHDAYHWPFNGEPKFPIEIKHLGVNASGTRISVLRVGHKIQEAIAGRPLSRYDHDPAQVQADTLWVARLIIKESQGAPLLQEEYDLLDAVTDTFDAAIQEARQNRLP